MTDKLYLYANSFPSIIEASELVKFERLVIITSNEEILKFCSRIKIEHINTGVPKDLSLKELFRYKKSLKNQLNSIRNKKVLFCFYSFDLFGLYAIKTLSKKNKVFFNNKDKHYKKTSHLRFWKRRISVENYLIYRLLLNIPLRQFEVTDKRTFLGVCYKKLEKNFPILISKLKKENFLQNSVLVRKTLSIHSNSYVIVDAGNFLFTFEEEYFLWINNNLTNGEIYLKPHPNYELANYDLIDVKMIEKSIPVELILDESMTIISVQSSTLFHEFPFDISKISLINLVKWKDEDEYDKCHERIINEKTIEVIKNEK